MARESRTTGLTYDDLVRMFPEEDHVRRELIDGELFVSPSAETRHQRVVVRLIRALGAFSDEAGGEVLVSPLDTMIAEDTVLQPDVLFYVADRVGMIGARPLTEPPDLAVEVSCPSTRARDLVQKKEKYAAFGVREYWFVDLDAERVEVYRPEGSGYGAPEIVERGGSFASPLLPGLTVAVDDVVVPPTG